MTDCAVSNQSSYQEIHEMQNNFVKWDLGLKESEKFQGSKDFWVWIQMQWGS